MTSKSTAYYRAAAIVLLMWIAFGQIYVQSGRPEISFIDCVFGTIATFVIGALGVGFAALFIDRYLSRMQNENLIFLIFPIIFPFMILMAHYADEKVAQKAEEIHARVKEKPQDEQFHLIDYVRKLLN